MADQDGEKGDKKEPPKIKLGLGKELEDLGKAHLPGTGQAEGKESTQKIDLSSAEPPPEEGTPGSTKKSTSRIDVSAAQPPPAKTTTTRIDIGSAQPSGGAKRSTTRIDPNQAAPGPKKKSTTRIDPSEAAPATPKKGTARIDPASATPPVFGKAATTRIDVSAAKPAGEASEVARGIPKKRETSPIRPADEDIQEAEVPDAAKYATQRIILEEESVSDETVRLETQALKAVPEDPSTKKQTSRIDLPESARDQEPDALKRHTTPLDMDTDAPTLAPSAEPKEPQPKTIRIKRPESVQTRIMPKPSAPSTPGFEAPPSDDEIEGAKKSETVRLDLPSEISERPPTRPKTIRIKRPDGTSAKRQLTVARPKAAPASVTEEAGELAEEALAAARGEDEPGGVFTALTLVALLVALVVVYVLLGQTYALDLPFPGRL